MKEDDGAIWYGMLDDAYFLVFFLHPRSINPRKYGAVCLSGQVDAIEIQ